jgi:broad specificity polyphosphatase/5'/3'-nucleotidase SurE
MNAGIPAIAFSGTTGTATAWNLTTPAYATVYAELATIITTQLLDSGAPYLPSGVWLNVNFPASTTTSCTSASDFEFVLSRIWTAFVSFSRQSQIHEFSTKFVKIH